MYSTDTVRLDLSEMLVDPDYIKSSIFECSCSPKESVVLLNWLACKGDFTYRWLLGLSVSPSLSLRVVEGSNHFKDEICLWRFESIIYDFSPGEERVSHSVTNSQLPDASLLLCYHSSPLLRNWIHYSLFDHSTFVACILGECASSPLKNHSTECKTANFEGTRSKNRNCWKPTP